MEVIEMTSDIAIAIDEDENEERKCSICLEVIRKESNRRFGLLYNCKHCFCWNCISTWRRMRTTYRKDKYLSCPVCMVYSPFAYPSKKWITNREEKDKLFQTHFILPRRNGKVQRSTTRRRCTSGREYSRSEYRVKLRWMIFLLSMYIMCCIMTLCILVFQFCPNCLKHYNGFSTC